MKKSLLILPILCISSFSISSCSLDESSSGLFQTKSGTNLSGKVFYLDEYNYNIYLNVNVSIPEENDGTFTISVSPAFDFGYYYGFLEYAYQLNKVESNGTISRSFVSYVDVVLSEDGYGSFSVPLTYKLNTLSKIYDGDISQLKRSISFSLASGYYMFEKQSDDVLDEINSEINEAIGDIDDDNDYLSDL